MIPAPRSSLNRPTVELLCITFRSPFIALRRVRRVNEGWFYALYVTVVITRWLFYILYDFLLFSFHRYRKRANFLAAFSVLEELFMLFVLFFLCCARRKGEWIWVYALLNLLKHRLRRRWQKEGNRPEEKQRQEVAKIAHSPMRRAKYVNFFL